MTPPASRSASHTYRRTTYQNHSSSTQQFTLVTTIGVSLLVRSKPERPLVCSLTLAHLANVLNVPAESDGVTYYGAQSRIADGYSFPTDDGLSVYGVAPNGHVQVIAFAQSSDSSPSAESLDRLKTLARELNLDLVYWCRCVRVAPDDPLFGSLLSNDAD
jgi:hypothetical protein